MNPVRIEPRKEGTPLEKATTPELRVETPMTLSPALEVWTNATCAC